MTASTETDASFSGMLIMFLIIFFADVSELVSILEQCIFLRDKTLKFQVRKRSYWKQPYERTEQN